MRSGTGRALAPTRGGYITVDLVAGTAQRVDVDGAGQTEFTAIGRFPNGHLVLGSAETIGRSGLSARGRRTR